ncbi:hypothetical protein NEOLEDRAFT_1147451 [Neolentinus lepideus HHB14362 ss-1]|uniref:Uncharacterized protein n=1 Tax=Neolentinus lepideus HHB14362 ss-1 TaxID=1314782 RepID=A0A165T1Z0_9AGAM|nr:hypothetical protein NEOLEDRAFT_1147451 [Neolentinus lepideus HHB14362 ss-1]
MQAWVALPNHTETRLGHWLRCCFGVTLASMDSTKGRRSTILFDCKRRQRKAKGRELFPAAPPVECDYARDAKPVPSHKLAKEQEAGIWRKIEVTLLPVRSAPQSNIISLWYGLLSISMASSLTFGSDHACSSLSIIHISCRLTIKKCRPSRTSSRSAILIFPLVLYFVIKISGAPPGAKYFGTFFRAAGCYALFSGRTLHGLDWPIIRLDSRRYELDWRARSR